MTIQALLKVSRCAWCRVLIYACGHVAADYGIRTGAEQMEIMRGDMLRATVREIYARGGNVIEITGVLCE